MDYVDRPQAMADTEEVSELRHRVQHYATLNSQENRYADLIENAEQHRHTVRDHIYEKVKGEYETKKLEVERERRKLEDYLQENLQRFLVTHERVLGTSEEESERLEELDFRIRVGEFAEEDFAEERETLNQRLLKYTEELGRIEEVLKEFTKAGLLQDKDKPRIPSREHEGQTPEDEEGPSMSLNERQTEEQDRSTVMVQQDQTPKEGLVSPVDHKPEDSRDNNTEPGFLVLEEDAGAKDEDCPVVCCPDAISQVTHVSDTELNASANDKSRDPASDGYVTGYLVAMEGSRQGDRFPMISSNITLGNSPGIDIRLDDGGISKFHARILYKDKKHYLENLDPMGRSFVNGIQADLVELKDGDVVRLGEIKLQVDYAPVEAD